MCNGRDRRAGGRQTDFGGGENGATRNSPGDCEVLVLHILGSLSFGDICNRKAK